MDKLNIPKGVYYDELLRQRDELILSLNMAAMVIPGGHTRSEALKLLKSIENE